MYFILFYFLYFSFFVLRFCLDRDFHFNLLNTLGEKLGKPGKKLNNIYSNGWGFLNWISFFW